MRLYQVPTPGGSVWYGTQADAKLGARELTSDPHSWQQVDVPTMPKEEFIDWLNSNTFIFGKAGCEDPEPDPLYEAEQRAIAATALPTVIVDHARAERVSRDWDATSIEEFILDRATVAQVERIFAVIGTRFKEHLNDTGSTRQA